MVKERDNSDAAILKRFMQEFFPFKQLVKAGFFTKEMKGDYAAQAKRVCKFFGYGTVYEYRASTTRAHISYAKGHRPNDEPFLTVLPSIYEE